MLKGGGYGIVTAADQGTGSDAHCIRRAVCAVYGRRRKRVEGDFFGVVRMLLQGALQSLKRLVQLQGGGEVGEIIVDRTTSSAEAADERRWPYRSQARSTRSNCPVFGTAYFSVAVGTALSGRSPRRSRRA
jgi:hypothetical protein